MSAGVPITPYPPSTVDHNDFIIDSFEGPPQASSSHHSPVATTSTLPVQGVSIFPGTEPGELPVEGLGLGDLPGEQYQLDDTENETLPEMPEMQE